MKRLKLSLLLLCVLISHASKSWDEVTHAYMTRMIPDMIKNEELKQLLHNNLEEYVYGCWLTDTYQYTDNRVNGLNPHNIEEYSQAFSSYLQKREVKKQENYEKLVALYLGSLSHIIEDFWYDSNLVHYQKTKPDKFKGDSKHGAFVIKQNGYLNLKVKRYFPKEDLFKMYSEAGMLKDGYNTLEGFSKMMDTWSNQQYLMLRALKFINFLGGNQMHNQSLWTAGNLKTINGGMKNSAEVAAKYIEAAWKNLNEKDAPLFLHADYFDFDNKIAVLASAPLNESDFLKSHLLNNLGDTIQGKFDQFEHKKRKEISKYAFSFYPNTPLQPEETYQLIINPDSQNKTSINLSVADNIEILAEKKPFVSTLGLGIFGFVLLLGIAFILFGIAGIIRFNRHRLGRERTSPLIALIIQGLFKLAGLAAFCIGIYLLVTRGAIIIEMAL